jgi:glutamate 5-kinase
MSEYRKTNPLLYGNSNATRKLTKDDVVLIREAHEHKQEEIKKLNDAYSARALSEKFGVHQRTIEKVLNYSTWRHV